MTVNKTIKELVEKDRENDYTTHAFAYVEAEYGITPIMRHGDDMIVGLNTQSFEIETMQKLHEKGYSLIPFDAETRDDVWLLTRTGHETEQPRI